MVTMVGASNLLRAFLMTSKYALLCGTELGASGYQVLALSLAELT